MIKSRTRVGQMRRVFKTDLGDEISAHVARLVVLYEDLRLETFAIAADQIEQLDLLDDRYRRLYFLRRSIATLNEFSNALSSLNGAVSFKSFKNQSISGQGKDWNRWDSALSFFERNRHLIKKVRNDIGGHFGPEAARYAVRNFESEATGVIELVAHPSGRGAGWKLRFAGEIAATALLRRLSQNFRFGTPTRTWYSLSSPECNDFTP